MQKYDDNCFTLTRDTQYLFRIHVFLKAWATEIIIKFSAMQAIAFLYRLTEATRTMFAFEAGPQLPL